MTETEELVSQYPLDKSDERKQQGVIKMAKELGANVYENDRSTRATRKLIFKLIWWMPLPFLFFTGVGIYGLINPGFIEDIFEVVIATEIMLLITIGFLLLSVALITIFIRKIKPVHVSVFENGLVVKSGEAMAELHFDEIEGLRRALGTIRVHPGNTDILNQKGDIFSRKFIRIPDGLTPNFKEVSEHLYAAYYDGHLLRDLSKETIKDRTFHFGSNVRLEYGKFIDGNREFPFDNLRKIRIPKQGRLIGTTPKGVALAGLATALEAVEITGTDTNGKKQSLWIPMDAAMNLEVLVYIARLGGL